MKLKLFSLWVFNQSSQMLLSDIKQDTVLGRQAKLFIGMMSLENKVDAFRSATPPYQLSEELKVCKLSFSLHKYSAKFHLHKVNITNYGMAVMLSVNISAYKGGVPRKHVLVRSSVFLMI